MATVSKEQAPSKAEKSGKKEETTKKAKATVEMATDKCSLGTYVLGPWPRFRARFAAAASSTSS